MLWTVRLGCRCACILRCKYSCFRSGFPQLAHQLAQAFEDDAERLSLAAREGWKLSVSQVAPGHNKSTDHNLQVFYVADQIDPESRALKFYLKLPNELVRDEQRDAHRFVAWKYRPGQRMEVKIPTAEPWENQMNLALKNKAGEGIDPHAGHTR